MAVEYGQSYTDKKTQSQMMKFLRQSNKFTGSSRKGKAKPRTQLNKDSVPKDDFPGNRRILSAAKGSPKGSEHQERVNSTPMKIPSKPQKQKNNYKPTGKKAIGRPKNTSKVNRKYK